MEQATNLFTKGLLIDSHPMVQSNDSLRDCLNGTLITMNGNEVILQNDMGNRRVNNAFLPPGYQPIGIKEYGGIIYVAAYNPITNKSQIGSFPSPQRKFNDVDKDGKLYLENFFNKDINYFDEDFDLGLGEGKNLRLTFVKSDTLFVLLTDDSNIYPGDKFTVYCSDLKERKAELTNYNNIEDDKILTPKNKDYTLYLGVLNSLNEFMDITPTLQRWNEENKIINFLNYNYNVSDNFKFNSGYFIPDDFKNESLQETLNDAEFIRARLALPINTYSSKLIGPLYLKAQFNHVQNFDYNINGYVYEDGGKKYVELTIEGFFTYNCLDLNLGELNLESEYTNEEQEGYVEGKFSGNNTEIYETDFSNQISSNIPTIVNIGGSSTSHISSQTPTQVVKPTPMGGYSNFEENDVDNPFSITKDSTEDSLMYNFNYTSGEATAFETKDNSGKQYIVTGTLDSVKILVEQNTESWEVPSIYPNLTGLKLLIPSKSIITIFTNDFDYYIDTIEIEGQVQNLELYTGGGEQRGATWNSGNSIPRRVSFTCDFAYITNIKVKIRNIDIKKQELADAGYSVVRTGNAISDFDFNNWDWPKYTFDNQEDRDMEDPNVILGSATLRISEHMYRIDTYDGGVTNVLVLERGCEFTIEVFRQYSILSIEIDKANQGELECISKVGTFLNNTWKSNSQSVNSVSFRYKTSDGVRGVIRKIIVRHTGCSEIPNDDLITRQFKIFTNYEILEKLQRNGASVSTAEAKKLTIISRKDSDLSIGLSPNIMKNTVSIVSNHKIIPDSKIIAWGHFEDYKLTQSELDKINDGYERKCEDYYAIRLVYDSYSVLFDSEIELTKDITFNVDKYAFGDFYFGEYLIDRENPELIKAEDCSVNDSFLLNHVKIY